VPETVHGIVTGVLLPYINDDIDITDSCALPAMSNKGSCRVHTCTTAKMRM